MFALLWIIFLFSSCDSFLLMLRWSLVWVIRDVRWVIQNDCVIFLIKLFLFCFDFYFHYLHLKFSVIDFILTKQRYVCSFIWEILRSYNYIIGLTGLLWMFCSVSVYNLMKMIASLLREILGLSFFVRSLWI